MISFDGPAALTPQPPQSFAEADHRPLTLTVTTRETPAVNG